MLLIGAGFLRVIQYGGTDFFSRTGDIFTFWMIIATPACFQANEYAKVISFRQLDVFSPGYVSALVGL